MKVYKLSENQIFTKVSGETVILDQETGEYFGLNETATLVWDALEKSPKSFQALKSVVLENYSVEEETCVVDLEYIINEFLKNNLIVESE